MQINYANDFPIRAGVHAVETLKRLTHREAVRLWWLPKKFTCTLSIDSPIVPSPGTPVVLDFSGENALVRNLPGGWPNDERSLCDPGLDEAGVVSYGTGARYSAFLAQSGFSVLLAFYLFLPRTTPSVHPGVWTDGTHWRVRSSMSAVFGTPTGDPVLIHTFRDTPDGVLGTHYKVIEPTARYYPEAGVEASYEHPLDTTYLWVQTADVGDWTVEASFTESEWWTHNGLWSPSPGTARLRAP
jgi:hypothetical protein